MTGSLSPPVVLAAGGTGGHVYPALALSQELERRGYGVVLVTDERGLVYSGDFPARKRMVVASASLTGTGPAGRISGAVLLGRGLVRMIYEFVRRRPCAVAGFGGYPSLPAVQAAALTGIPYGIHEQNRVLGRANRFLAGRASFIAHGFPSLERIPANARGVTYTGNPVRDCVSAFRNAPVPAGEKAVVLVVGGSQGSRLLSRIPALALAALPGPLRTRLKVVHQVRDGEYEAVRGIYENAGMEYVIAPFFSSLPARMAQAHLVIARAGASTLTELSVTGRASVLVPLRIAADDHQTLNAAAFAEKNAAVVMEESRFDEKSLGAVLRELLDNPGRLSVMASAAQGLMLSDAASVLAGLVEKIAAGKNLSAKTLPESGHRAAQPENGS